MSNLTITAIANVNQSKILTNRLNNKTTDNKTTDLTVTAHTLTMAKEVLANLNEVNKNIALQTPLSSLKPSQDNNDLQKELEQIGKWEVWIGDNLNRLSHMGSKGHWNIKEGSSDAKKLEALAKYLDSLGITINGESVTQWLQKHQGNKSSLGSTYRLNAADLELLQAVLQQAYSKRAYGGGVRSPLQNNSQSLQNTDDSLKSKQVIEQKMQNLLSSMNAVLSE